MRRAAIAALAIAAAVALPEAAAAAAVRVVVVPGAVAEAALMVDGATRAEVGSGGASPRIAIGAGSVVRIATPSGSLAHVVGAAPRQTLLVARFGGRLRVIGLDDPAVAAAGARQVRIVDVADGLAGASAGVHRSAQPQAPLRAGRPTRYFGVPRTPAACPALAVLDVRAGGAIAGLPRIGLKGASSTVVIHRYDAASMYPFEVFVVGDGAQPAAAPPGFVDDPSGVLADPSPVAPGIRLFHALSRGGAVDVRVGGLSRRLVYGQGTPHLPVGPGTHAVVVSQGGEVLVRTTVRLTGARPAATVLISGEAPASAAATVLHDEPPVDGESARLRIVQAQPGAGRLDLDVLGGGPVVRGLGYRAASAYVAIDDALAAPCLGVARIAIRRSGTTIKQSFVTIDPGVAYTAFVIRPRGAPAGAVKLVALRDGRRR